MIPYADFPIRPSQHLTASRIYVLRSMDGGVSFEVPRFVADMPRAFPGGGVSFATDASIGKFSGRIYALWEDGDFGPELVAKSTEIKREESGERRGLAISYSTDNGRTWSVPRQLAKPGLGPAFMGCLAVAPNGTLGALWIQHEKYATDPQEYRAWFAASTDGGEAFTTPQALSSHISRPDRTRRDKVAYIRTRPRGGDYIGLAATANSVFHAVWSDARDGLFCTFHAPVRVSL